jgi:hypothetical protein
MTSASHAEGRQFDPGLVYLTCSWRALVVSQTLSKKHWGNYLRRNLFHVQHGAQ